MSTSRRPYKNTHAGNSKRSYPKGRYKFKLMKSGGYMAVPGDRKQDRIAGYGKNQPPAASKSLTSNLCEVCNVNGANARYDGRLQTSIRVCWQRECRETATA